MGKNSYIEAESHFGSADGGQGQFGAISPNNWRVPGTSPVGQKSFAGGADGGDEPWFAEAVSTVFLDLKKADETVKAFTNEMGYDAFLEASVKNLDKAWKKLHPVEKKPDAKPKAKSAADKPKAKTAADEPKAKTAADKPKAKSVANK